MHGKVSVKLPMYMGRAVEFFPNTPQYYTINAFVAYLFAIKKNGMPFVSIFVLEKF